MTKKLVNNIFKENTPTWTSFQVTIDLLNSENLKIAIVSFKWLSAWFHEFVHDFIKNYLKNS